MRGDRIIGVVVDEEATWSPLPNICFELLQASYGVWNLVTCLEYSKVTADLCSAPLSLIVKGC